MILTGVAHFLTLYYLVALLCPAPYREWTYHVSTVHAIVVTLASIGAFLFPISLWIGGFMLAYFGTDLLGHYFRRHLKPASFVHHIVGVILLLGFLWRQYPSEMIALPKFTIIEASTPFANRLWLKKKSGKNYETEGYQFMAIFFLTRIVWFPIAVASTSTTWLASTILWGLYGLQWWWFGQMLNQVYGVLRQNARSDLIDK